MREMQALIRPQGNDTPSIQIVREATVAMLNGVNDISPPAAWASRTLYLGKAGAESWLDVVGETGYPLRDPDCFGLRANRRDALQGLRMGTLVSLGPGEGFHDIDLVNALRRQSTHVCETGEHEQTLRYIPVELSQTLLERALRNLSPHVDIPVGILCDFEDGQGFLAEMLEEFAQPPILFSMLGGTVGNLDGGDASFFAGLRGLLKTDDAFLLDVPLAGPAWTVAEDPRLRADGYSTAFRRFLGSGIAKVDPDGHRDLETRTERLVAEFGERLDFTHEHDSRTGAEVITVLDRPSQRTVLTFRRYRWDPILRWLQDQRFTVSYAKCSISSSQDKFGMGVVLLGIG